MTDGRLRRHLDYQLGRWEETGGVVVVGSTLRERPGWDGRVRPAIGICSPRGGVLSVPPRLVDAVAAVAGDEAALATALPGLLAAPGHQVFRAVFRWSVDPAPLPDAGEWTAADEPAVPEWLRPFGGAVLVARDPTGRYLAGVGIKHHDRFGRELAVVTEPAARGRGLARRLVAQAARQVLDEGAVPTYWHDPSNTGSARVADAAGFPDRGWSACGLSDEPP